MVPAAVDTVKAPRPSCGEFPTFFPSTVQSNNHIILLPFLFSRRISSCRAKSFGESFPPAPPIRHFPSPLPTPTESLWWTSGERGLCERLELSSPSLQGWALPKQWAGKSGSNEWNGGRVLSLTPPDSACLKTSY